MYLRRSLIKQNPRRKCWDARNTKKGALTFTSQHNESLENRGQHRFFSFSVNNYDSCFPNNIMLRFNLP